MIDTKERNEEIYNEWMAGASLVALAQKHNITSTRIRSICLKLQKKHALEEDALFLAIRKKTDNEDFAIKTYHVLKRNDIHTLADARKLTEKRIDTLWQCGPVMKELIQKL